MRRGSTGVCKAGGSMGNMLTEKEYWRKRYNDALTANEEANQRCFIEAKYFMASENDRPTAYMRNMYSNYKTMHPKGTDG
jgi:hypothetical protein